MKSRRKTSLLAELRADQRARIRGGRYALPPRIAFAEDEALLARAEQRVRRRIWLRRTLPMNLILLVPGLCFIGTRSRVVLAAFIATYPLVFVFRALLGRLLSALVGPEEILVREELERLRSRREGIGPAP